jgi:PhzF family phenazine biosynthesis protein
MASGPTTFMTCVVFTAERYQGNPLAIVSVRANSLTEKRKSLIAKEFGYSETVFIHDAPGPGLPRRLDIFTEKGEEIPFAGHPIIGAAHYIFQIIKQMAYRGPADRDTQRQSAVFMTKAGPIPVFYNPYRQLAACTVPHKFHVHSKQVSMDKVLAVQPQIQIIPTFEKVSSRAYPVVSIVHGMTFALVDLTDAPEVLAGLKKGEAPEVELDEEWKPSFCGAMYYVRKGVTEQGVGQPVIVNLHCRMIVQGFEDPGTGSASCALACYLTTVKTTAAAITTVAATASTSDDLVEKTEGLKLEEGKVEHSIFAIEQGIEMGRKCMIAVEVDTKWEGEQQKIQTVILSGRANFHSKGEILYE